MEKELVLPGLGENIEAVQVSKLLIEPGETVETDQALMEVEADKAVVEVPASEAGTLKQFLVGEGDTVKVGEPFALLDTEKTEQTPREPPDPDARPVDDTSEPEAEPDQQKAEQKATGAAEKAPEKTAEQPSAQTSERPADTGTTRRAAGVAAVSDKPHVPAAPSVRRFAREIGIDVDTVRGSGPHGRVSIEDVKRHAREQNQKRRQPGGMVSTPPLPDFSKYGPVRRERMSGIRVATADQVTRCWLNIPRVTHCDSADITQLEFLRKRYKERAAKAGGNLTMAVMVVKVVAEALRKFPRFNASVDMDNHEVVYKDYVNVGIAVATERGLLVPVLRNADQRNMVQLAADIDRIAKRCREGKVTRDELEGGTFTVTNLGSIGGSFFAPIVNWPEVAILGMGRAAEQVKMEDGTPVSRVILPLSLSYDHRIIDGADAARFVRWIAEAIEEPLLLSLEGGPQ